MLRVDHLPAIPSHQEINTKLLRGIEILLHEDDRDLGGVAGYEIARPISLMI